MAGVSSAASMRAARVLLVGVLLSAPVAPFVFASGAAKMACCLLHEGGGDGGCCPDSAECSIRRCPGPETSALPSLPPVVLTAEGAAGIVESGEPVVPTRTPALLSLASDLPDPPPRA